MMRGAVVFLRCCVSTNVIAIATKAQIEFPLLAGGGQGVGPPRYGRVACIPGGTPYGGCPCGPAG